jgi:uncharacterized membrane protein YbhN (UPF0104 family)
LRIALANMCATYSASAGTPVTAYLMARRGVPAGRATAFALIQQTMFVPAALGPACVLALLAPGLAPSGAVRTTLWLTGGLAVVIIAVFVAMAVWPRGALRAARFLARGRLQSAVEDFVVAGGAMLREHPGRLLAAALCSVVNQAAVAAASVVLLAGLGASGAGSRGWAISYVFAAVSQAAPTPGGAGVSEVAGAYLMKGLFAPAAVAAHVVIWRFCAIQLPIICGGFVLADELRAYQVARMSTSPNAVVDTTRSGTRSSSSENQ